MAGVVDERDESGLLAAGAGAAADLSGQAFLFEFSDELPDRGAGRAGEYPLESGMLTTPRGFVHRFDKA